MTNKKKSIEVCFSPKLYEDIKLKENFIVVIVDILRATTSMCTAFEYGVKEIIPVAGLDEVKKFKEDGYLVAAERDGKAQEFADFGNSSFNFMTPLVSGKSIAYSTTNGTQAIEMAKQNSDEVVLGSFNNISALRDWLVEQNKSIVVLCSGWKNRFNLEDSFFAGALVEKLQENNQFEMDCDSATAALDLWNTGKNDILSYMDKAIHRNRLKTLGQDDVVEHTFMIDINEVVPVLKDGILINIQKSI